VSNNPTPKLDALRAMREERFGKRPTPKAPVAALREKIAAVPVKKREKVKP
jgi:hypothetical protein